MRTEEEGGEEEGPLKYSLRGEEEETGRERRRRRRIFAYARIELPDSGAGLRTNGCFPFHSPFDTLNK